MTPWDVLGIDPTDDPRAIRSAYVRVLKTIDVEADPRAFVALREAFEAANIEAARAAIGAEPAAAAADVSAGPGPGLSQEPEASVEPSAALARLLLGRYVEHAPSQDEAIEMLRLWSAIAADPRMQQVGFFADVERWASELIARTIPFSDPLVVPAVLQFGWRARAGTIHLSPAAAYLAARSVPLNFANEIKQPGHPLNQAWQELTRPADADGKFRKSDISPLQIDKLVGTVLRQHPELYSQFDPRRLALWQVKPANYLPEGREVGGVVSATRYVWLFLVGAWALAAIVNFFVHALAK